LNKRKIDQIYIILKVQYFDEIMLSNLILIGTLLVNAGAVLNFRLTKKKEDHSFDADFENTTSTSAKIKEFLNNLQYFRLAIAVWNMLVMFGMLTVFGSN